MLEKFENCKRLSFTQPLDIAELLKHAARQTLDPADSTEENIKELVEFLQSKSEMLEEYFSIGINAIDCRLTTFPLLLDGYQICMDKLPMFLLRLALEVFFCVEANVN
jgi:DNA mismatch repair protein MLH1